MDIRLQADPYTQVSCGTWALYGIACAGDFLAIPAGSQPPHFPDFMEHKCKTSRAHDADGLLDVPAARIMEICLRREYRTLAQLAAVRTRFEPDVGQVSEPMQCGFQATRDSSTAEWCCLVVQAFPANLMEQYFGGGGIVVERARRDLCANWQRILREHDTPLLQAAHTEHELRCEQNIDSPPPPAPSSQLPQSPTAVLAQLAGDVMRFNDVHNPPHTAPPAAAAFSVAAVGPPVVSVPPTPVAAVASIGAFVASTARDATCPRPPAASGCVSRTAYVLVAKRRVNYKWSEELPVEDESEEASKRRKRRNNRAKKDAGELARTAASAPAAPAAPPPGQSVQRSTPSSTGVTFEWMRVDAPAEETAHERTARLKVNTKRERAVRPPRWFAGRACAIAPGGMCVLAFVVAARVSC